MKNHRWMWVEECRYTYSTEGNMVRVFWAFFLSFYFFIFGSWVFSFTSLDEGRNASAILNMLKSHNFLVPYYNCQPRFEKPPMLYWVVVLFSGLLGFNELIARMVSGLSALGTAIMTYLIAKRYMDEETAKKSFLILLTLPHLWIESRALTPEMLNTFFMMVSLYLFLSERILLGWLFLSMAFLTKGPVGVFLTLLVYLIWRKDLKVFSWRGLAIFLAVGGSWYFYMFYKFGYDYFFRFFVYENVMRYTGQRLTHPSPFYYYLLVVFATTIFYIPMYLKVIKNFKRELLPYLTWFLAVIVFFSLAKNKLHHYILFAYPPMSVILASTIEERYIKKVLLLSAGVLLVMLLALGFYERLRFTPKAYPFLESQEAPAYFYKSEDSALVFYSKRCIPNEENTQKLSGLVITKEKYTKELPQCSLLTEGIEFDGRYVLLRCP